MALWLSRSVVFSWNGTGLDCTGYAAYQIMILNAPSFFNSVFAMVKPLLNEATKKKIDLLPVAHAGDEMLKVIPSESLPPHYGGTSQVSLSVRTLQCILAAPKKSEESISESASCRFSELSWILGVRVGRAVLLIVDDD